jgi:hypothetical protein
MAVVLEQIVDHSHYQYEHHYKFVREPAHPSTLQFIAYWRECEAKGGLRLGRDVPARPIAALLQNFTVTEPVGDWEDAHMRHAGVATVEYFGRDVTGSLLSEIIAGGEGELDMFLAGCRDTIAKNRPGTLEHMLLNEGREILRQEITALPVFAHDGKSRWILCGTFDFPSGTSH